MKEVSSKEHVVHRTDDEIKFMKQLNSKGKLGNYYNALKLRENWDDIDRDAVMSAAEEMMGV